MWFKTKKIHIAVSHYHALFIFLIVEGDHNVIYVRIENVDVSIWLGIRPIKYPNYDIHFRFIDNFNKQNQIYGG